MFGQCGLLGFAVSHAGEEKGSSECKVVGQSVALSGAADQARWFECDRLMNGGEKERCTL